MEKIIIVGGGVAGLFAARELSKHDYEITILEVLIDWVAGSIQCGILYLGSRWRKALNLSMVIFH